MSSAYEMADSGGYPYGLDVEGPQPQNRLSVLLRLIYAIPHLIAMAVLGLVASVMTLIAWVVILITGKYPEGMANFVLGAFRWGARASGYCYLLTDKYPAFSMDEDSAYPVRFVASPVQIDGRNRVTVLFRIIMVIPHAIIVQVLTYAAEVVAFISWVAALFTGSVPPGLHTFMAGVLRWQARYYSYAALLTDEYPPFSLN